MFLGLAWGSLLHSRWDRKASQPTQKPSHCCRPAGWPPCSRSRLSGSLRSIHSFWVPWSLSTKSCRRLSVRSMAAKIVYYFRNSWTRASQCKVAWRFLFLSILSTLGKPRPLRIPTGQQFFPHHKQFCIVNCYVIGIYKTPRCFRREMLSLSPSLLLCQHGGLVFCKHAAVSRRLSDDSGSRVQGLSGFLRGCIF